MKRNHDVGPGVQVIKVLNTQTGREELVVVDPHSSVQDRTVARYRQDAPPPHDEPYYDSQHASRRGDRGNTNFPPGRRSAARVLLSFALFAGAVPVLHNVFERAAYKGGAAAICWAKQNSLANVAINAMLPTSDVLCEAPKASTTGMSSTAIPSAAIEIAVPELLSEREVL
jgi:hypothetical protein